MGYDILRELTAAAHAEKPGSLVVGEIVNYPARWLQSLDAVMGFTFRLTILGVVGGTISPAAAGRMLARMVNDAGIEPLLRSWLMIDNHDLPRIAWLLPVLSQRRIAQALQFSLPGAPNIYYGSEVGMTGGPDPENRAPMRWDLLHDANPELIWMRQLIALRKTQRALRIGDFRLIEAEHLLAFERYTDRALETVIAVANPSVSPVRETVMVANPSLMDVTPMVDLLSPASTPSICSIEAGLLHLNVPPETIYLLQPREQELGGYSRYKRVE
jgi:glycosidase